MSEHRPERTGRSKPLHHVNTNALETFVDRANSGALDEYDIDGLAAAATAVETLLAESSEESTTPQEMPSAAKWAAAAGCQLPDTETDS